MENRGDRDTQAGYSDHWRFVTELREQAPIGSVAFMRHLKIKQPHVYKRIRNDLIGMNVVRFQGGRGASCSLVLGDVDFGAALDAGFEVRPGREINLYPLLLGQIDEMVTAFHAGLRHVLAKNKGRDGVVPYLTSSLSVSPRAGSFTRPDITVVADLDLDHANSWTDVHAIEVKPYWALGRDGLFETAAQAALQRCSFAWLVAFIPPSDAPGLNQAERKACDGARKLLEGKSPALAAEAANLGIGVAVASSLKSDAQLKPLVMPRRQVMDPLALEALLESLRAE